MRVCMTRVTSIGGGQNVNVPLCMGRDSVNKYEYSNGHLASPFHTFTRNRSRRQYRPMNCQKLPFTTAKKLQAVESVQETDSSRSKAGPNMNTPHHIKA